MASTSNVIKNGKIRRFSPWMIFCHWFYAACFIVLLVTGFGFAFDSLAFLAGPTSRYLHRIAAIGLMIGPVLYLFGSPREAANHIKNAFTWTRDDVVWLTAAIPYHFTGRPTPPPQGFLNAGQKMNYLVVTTTFVVFVASGLFMWTQRPELTVAEQGLFWWATLAHSAAAWIAAAMFFLHVYLAGIHPFTRPSLRGMIDGYVSLDYALFEHPKWAAQFVGKEGARGAAS